jgi:hypothetical protein
MSRATYAKIARRHSQSDPGDWTAPDVTPAVWIAEVAQPRLADLLTPPSKLSPLETRLDTRQPTSVRADNPNQAFGGQPVWLVGVIHLEPARSDHGRYEQRRSYYADSRDWISFGLYWVGNERRIAIAPSRMHEYSYQYIYGLSDLAYLPGPEALRALVTDLLEQLRQKLFNQQKREKVRGLQLQAIKAQLKQIANEEQFEFYVQSTKLLIRIGIRLEGNTEILLSVPFTEFENALPELRGMVVNLRALSQRRIRFKTQQQSRHTSWITPDPPAASSDITLTPTPLPPGERD